MHAPPFTSPTSHGPTLSTPPAVIAPGIKVEADDAKKSLPPTQWGWLFLFIRWLFLFIPFKSSAQSSRLVGSGYLPARVVIIALESRRLHRTSQQLHPIGWNEDNLGVME
ncbi:unnamed protein product [Calypogeia fissa]